MRFDCCRPAVASESLPQPNSDVYMVINEPSRPTGFLIQFSVA